jgi:hypothetical protein
MKTVWKYSLDMVDQQVISMPIAASILCVQTQREVICLWALVDPDEKRRANRRIRIAGTGHPIGELEILAYIGTAQLQGGDLAFHVFEKFEGMVNRFEGSKQP